MDYRLLLLKYIKHIEKCEGMDYITNYEWLDEDEKEFTEEEWSELVELAQESLQLSHHQPTDPDADSH